MIRHKRPGGEQTTVRDSKRAGQMADLCTRLAHRGLGAFCGVCGVWPPRPRSGNVHDMLQYLCLRLRGCRCDGRLHI